MLDAHRHTSPPPVRQRRPNIPVELAQLLDRLLAKDPKDRPASGEEVADALAPFAAGHQLPATPATAVGQGQRTPSPARVMPRKRRRVPVLVGVGFLAVLAGGSLVAVALMRPFRTGETGPTGVATSSSTSATATIPDGPVVLQPSKKMFGHDAGVRSLAFTPDGKVLASGSEDRTIVLWNAGNWTPRGRLEGHFGEVIGLAFEKDSRKLASTVLGKDECAIRLWDVASCTPAKTVGGPWEGLFAVAWMPDGKTLVTAGTDNQLNFWDIATDRRETIDKICAVHVRGLSISPNGKLLATGGTGPTRLWDLATRKEVPSQLPRDICPLFLPPDGAKIAGWDHPKGSISICDLASGKVRPWRAHPGKIEGLATSADGRFLASVGAGVGTEGIGYVWSVADLTVVATLRGHGGRIADVAFTPDGKHLGTAGLDDHAVLIWDLPPVCHVEK